MARPLRLLSLLVAGCGAIPQGVDGAAAAKAANQKASPEIFNVSAVIKFSGTKTDGVACNAETSAIAWCETTKSVVFCDGAQWRTIACTTVLKDSSCVVDAENVVRCK